MKKNEKKIIDNTLKTKVNDDSGEKKAKKFVEHIVLRGEAMKLLGDLKKQMEMPAEVLVWHALKQFEIWVNRK